MTELEAVYADHVEQEVKLGRAKASPKPKLMLDRYVDFEQVLPHLRRSVGHALGLDDFRMCGNDRLGDCTCAAVEHGTHILSWQDKHGVDQPEDEKAAVDLYWATGSQDDGRVISNVLGYVRQNGYKGDKGAILGYVGVDTSKMSHVAAAIDLLGGVDIGVWLPIGSQRQRRTWDVGGDPANDPNWEPGGWGGHSVWVQGYNHLAADDSHVTGTLPLITWGSRMYMTQRYWDTYVDEAFAIVSQEWLNKQGKSPRGFDLAALESDLKAL